MKRFKKLLTFFVLIAIVLSFAGCDSAAGDLSDGLSGYAPSYTGEKAMDGELSGESSEKNGSTATDEDAEEKTDDKQQQSGLMTAAAWNDNQYYSAWKELFLKGQTEIENGKFLSFFENNDWGFLTTKRVAVTVKNGENVVAGATVTYFDEAQKEYAAKTDSAGIAYLFPSADAGTVTVAVGETVKTADFTAENRDLTVDIGVDNQKAQVIKLMFVLDVTGSMGDELEYLKNELADVIGRVASANNGVRIDLAVLFYRDNGDTEKFSYADFTDVTEAQGLSEQQQKLNAQRALGGGDYPEAVDEALALAMSKDWGDENSTKIIFHVLDAPAHNTADNKTTFYNAVALAAKKGIRICPVLCSGADSLCEYLVRNEAIVTGGTFTFVTDHSGIGNAHLDPDLPNVVIEKLNDMMVRLISGYYTGTFEDPVWFNAKPTQTEQQ